jgi:hypothetical protein
MSDDKEPEAFVLLATNRRTVIAMSGALPNPPLRLRPLVTGRRIAFLCSRQAANHVTIMHGRSDALYDRHTRLRSAPHRSAWVPQRRLLRGRSEKAARAAVPELQNPNLLRQTRRRGRGSAPAADANDDCRQLPILGRASWRRWFGPPFGLVGFNGAGEAVELFFFGRAGSAI